MSPATLYANPDGAQIISGQVNIDTSTAGVANITNSPNAIIHWQNFNIAQNEITRFIQQNSQSAVLNRIIGENPSQILGQLLSNGKVLLINPNGIVFGANSVVDTQGLIASSLNLSDEDFLKGNYHFFAGSQTGNIVNEGIIRAGKDGNIVLIAPNIKNNGIIKTEGGQITLAAGQELILTSLDDPDIRFAVQAPNNSVLNLGKLLAEGGAVNVFANTIKHQGEINADGVEMDAQGHIKLVAQHDISLTESSKVSANSTLGDAGNIHIESRAGTVSLQGSVEANASQIGKGGQIKVLGEQVGVLDNARISSNGGQGGGEILVGGDFQGKNPVVHNAKATFIGADTRIDADAKNQGNGGKVIVWSDKYTRAYGHISAKGGEKGGDGGFVETSGHALDASGIKVDASAAKGNNGKWLLDPNNITIQALGHDTHVKGNPDWTTENDDGLVTTGSIQAALNNGTSVTVTTGTSGTNSQAGNITVASGIVKSAGGDASLSLQAHNNIDINAAIIAKTGKLDLMLTPNSDGTGGGMTSISSLIDLNNGTLTLNSESQVLFSGGIHNATLTIPELAVSKFNGLLNNVPTINIGQSAKLTINRANAGLNTVINNNGMLDINAFFVMNTLNLNSGSLSGGGNVTVKGAFNFHSGTALTGSGVLTTVEGAQTTLKDSGIVYVDKQWNNLGTIDWSGQVGISHTTGNAAFYNFATGNININAPGVRELNTGLFHNRGTLNLTDGVLKILSPGNDTGSYKVSGAGLLQFLSPGIRNFVGADVNSTNTVAFANGINNFSHNSSYYAPQTEVNNFATLSFNTGKAVTLSELAVDQATLSGVDPLTISDKFAMHSGSLTGFGKLTTATASVTDLADKGLVNLNKHWDNDGTVNWKNADFVDNGTVSVFTNAPSGTINIGSATTVVEKEFSINTARFNNQGTVNLAGGTLKIFSPGFDTGSYQVSGNGQLQFWHGLRVFDSAEIHSPNTVKFSNGKNYFRNGAVYSAAQTELISEAVLNFSNHEPITISKLTIDGGTLEGSDAVTITDTFNFHAGTVKGGALTTTAGTVTTLADKDTAYLGKTWDNWGAVTWNGVANIRNPSNINAAFNNRLGGVINIHAADSTAMLEINLTRFNNAGTLNLSSGQLKISSPGTDTGSYQVSESGQLQFWSGNRVFDSHAVVNSINKVSFGGAGQYVFKAGSNYSAAETGIDAAHVLFNTGNTLKMPILTIANDGRVISSDNIEISKRLDFSYGLFTGNGLLTSTSAGTITNLDDGGALLDKNWENYGIVNFSAGAVTINPPGTGSLRHWNNYGVINWQGEIAPVNDLGSNIVLTNKAEGIFNIDSVNAGAGTAGRRILNLGGFNNDGTVNITGGLLQILSPGTDTGTYDVSSNGQLEFKDSDRIFDGASIFSNSPVLFTDNMSFFKNHAYFDTSSNSTKIVIDGGEFTINTPLSLNKVAMTKGTIHNSAGLTVIGQFDWSGGTVAGSGAYQFDDFVYSGGLMAATGAVLVSDNNRGSLILPSMPSISRLSAFSAGQLTLTGDIRASGQGTAIVMETKQFNNKADALLSAPNGRWLVYSDTPAENTLSGLGSNFKHYGCPYMSLCNDGFDAATASGNGLLYSIIPVLSVTPDKFSSVYGDPTNLSASYSGFIDGDNVGSAGIGGTAGYAVSGSLSGAGYYHVGSHEVAYLNGLTNQLGYKLQDNTASKLEWTITPRDLMITADAAGKTYGELDPLLSYHASGLLVGDSLTGSVSRLSGENVGDYEITQGGLAASSDYKLSYSASNLSITPRDLNIIANPQSKLLGELDPMLTYQSAGLVNGDTLSGFLSRMAGETVGRYLITQGNLAASRNYHLTYRGADLTINGPHSDPVIVGQQENVQQNQVLVLTQQATFNEQLDNVTTNNTPTVSNKGAVVDDAKKDRRKPLEQCQ
ncbi:MAG: MBG domain-containing protein [Methylovulum sp.]|nr:MBG domain-containing protein [Methylovulum sp.]MDD5125959.1 MBG domain-containing protein [Methylovulum sp.]